jgi:hypothetical protein
LDLGLGEEDMSTGWSAKSLKVIGGPDRDRTGDLFHAITTNACNLLILGASVATRSILEHPKTALSTFASTFKKHKEEV